jgi:GT2 family glycosyltransferase
VRSFPTFGSQLAILLKLPHLFPRIVDSYLAKDFDYSREQVVDSIRGSYFAIHARALEACAGLDTRYFIWFEDVDVCREAKRLGYKVMFTPVISCIDYAGQSFKKQNWLKRQKQFFVSAEIYLKKWEPRYKSFFLGLIAPVGMVLVWLYIVLGKFFPFARLKNAIER